MDKILKIQTEIGVLSKDQENPFFKSKYLDINGLLAQLLPLLEKHRLVIMQPLTIKDGKNVLSTSIYDLDGDDPDNESSNFKGKWIEVDCDIILPDLQDPQKIGSAITYYRRYALQSLFLLQAQDDDGNHASAPVEEKKAWKSPGAKKVEANNLKTHLAGVAAYENGEDPLA